ncbi:MAG: TIGR00366 family protein [Bacteroidota bacterium]
MKFSDRLLQLFRYYLPSPFTLAVLLTVFTFILAMIMTSPDPSNSEPHFFQMIGHWQKGFWELLGFAMQMMLMLVLGHVLALSDFFKKVVDRSLVFCRDKASAAFIVTFVTVAVAYFNWGLGLIVGAILARKVGEYARINNIKINYALIGAAGYAGLMVWHGGISGSAPLKIAEEGHMFAEKTGGLPIYISETVGSTMNISLSVVLLFLLPLAMYWLASRSSADIPDIQIHEPKSDAKSTGPETPAERLDYSRIVSLFFAAALFFMFLYQFIIKPGEIDPSAINPNLINLLLLSLCLALHKHFRAFLDATETAIKGSTGIMIQFPLYAGIMGIMKYSGMAALFSQGFVEISNETTFPIFTLISAGIVNFFVPSGGGQWGVQGGIVLDAAQFLAENAEAAKDLGVEEVQALVRAAQAKAVMALSYGDQLTNMLQPFWALPLLGITGLKARQILPYTMFLMLVGFLVFVVGLLLF